MQNKRMGMKSPEQPLWLDKVILVCTGIKWYITEGVMSLTTINCYMASLLISRVQCDVSLNYTSAFSPLRNTDLLKGMPVFCIASSSM